MGHLYNTIEPFFRLRQALRLAGLLLLFAALAGFPLATAAPIFITGQTVLKRGGVPLPGANITLYKEGQPDAAATGQSLQNGAYFLRCPAPGRYLITADATDCAPFDLTVDVPATGLSGLKLELSGPPMIPLRVTTPDGKPLTTGVLQVWASVTMEKSAPLEPVFTVSLSQSSVLVFSDAPWISYDSARNIHLWVWAAGVGYAQAELPGWPAASVALRLQPGGTIAGRALGAKGKPAGGIVVSAVASGRESHTLIPGRLSTLTGKDGRFCISALPYGNYRLEVLFSDGGYSACEVVLEKERVEVTLRP